MTVKLCHLCHQYWPSPRTLQCITNGHDHGPLTRYVKLRVAHAPGMPGTFPCHWLQRKPLVSYPGMHHGTCVTHVPWCMSGSLTRGGGENVPGACATHYFMYLTGGPLTQTYKGNFVDDRTMYLLGKGWRPSKRESDLLLNGRNVLCYIVMLAILDFARGFWHHTYIHENGHVYIRSCEL